MNGRVALCLAWSLVLVGCSGDTTATATSTTTTTVTTTTTTVAETTTAVAVDARLEALREMVDSYGTPGGIAVVLDADGRWIGAVGDADNAGTAATVSMRFRAASITKTVVATIVLTLVADGLLDLDQTVEEIRPGLLADGSVTVRQLLDHSSGLFNIGDESDPVDDIAAIADPDLRAEAEELMAAYFDLHEDVVVPPEIIVAMVETHPRYFPAGTGYHYSNPNYQVLGMLIEAVTAESLATALADRIAAPAGLDSFALAPDDRTSPEFRGFDYPVISGAPTDTTDDLIAFGNGGNGGLLTTVDDLARFFRELFDGQLISDELLEDMITPSAPSVALGQAYGLGIGPNEYSCGTFYGHQGSVNGTVSIALSDRDGARVVVIALNARHPQAPDLVGLAETLVCSA